MPPKVLRRKIGKRRVGAKRYRKKRMVNVNRAMAPFAQRYITKLKYVTSAVLSTTNGYIYKMALNNLFDPDNTGIGHQPYGYDQLAALYNRYRVIKCYYTVSHNPTTGTNPSRVVCLPSNEFTDTFNSGSDAAENPRARWSFQMPGGSIQKIKGVVYLPSLVGRNKQQYMADDRYQALTTGGPNEAACLYLIGSDIADGAINVNVSITMTFVAEFFDVKKLAQS